MKVRVLIQVGRVPGDGAVETGALKVSVIRLVGGGCGRTEGGVLMLWRRRGGGAGAAVVTRAHLLSFNLTFLAGVLVKPARVTTRRARQHSSGSPAFRRPRGNAVGVRVDAG